MRRLALLLALIGGPSFAHELWLEPANYQVAPEGKLEASIVNGQNFEGVELSYLPQRFVLFNQHVGDQMLAVTGRIGDSPALNVAPQAEGLNIVAYQSTVSSIGYETWEKFERFAEHKDFPGIANRHAARSLPEADFKEAYTRFVKTLIGVGHSEGSDSRIGLETEFVALTNPYTDDISAGMRVQVFYQYDARADVQVEMFAKAPDGTVEVTLHRTDENGIATLPVQPGYAYLIDAVYLRAPSPELSELTGAVWETLWASMTFAIPD